jgi:dihydroorotate dehydrogenase electron transfer subunit
MSLNSHSFNKGTFDVLVTSNKKIGERFYRISLVFEGKGGTAFAKTSAGQFAELDLSTTALPPLDTISENLRDTAERKILLRRPFSFCDVTTKSGKTLVEILYCVVGPASLRMTTLSKGDSISVTGPLGNGFSVPKNKKIALLATGGMGAGPLIHLAKTLKQNYPDIKVTAFVGAKTAKELPFEKIRKSEPTDFARYNVKSIISTDDGSMGVRGLVTYCLTEWLDENKSAAKDIIIYSCGPEMMLARMAEIAQKYNVDCQISMERMMACGIGVCQSCAVECKVSGSRETVYKLCCKDGPVFDSREVVFEL